MTFKSLSMNKKKFIQYNTRSKKQLLKMLKEEEYTDTILLINDIWEKLLENSLYGVYSVEYFIPDDIYNNEHIGSVLSHYTNLGYNVEVSFKKLPKEKTIRVLTISYEDNKE